MLYIPILYVYPFPFLLLIQCATRSVKQRGGWLEFKNDQWFSYLNCLNQLCKSFELPSTTSVIRSNHLCLLSHFVEWNSVQNAFSVHMVTKKFNTKQYNDHYGQKQLTWLQGVLLTSVDFQIRKIGYFCVLHGPNIFKFLVTVWSKHSSPLLLYYPKTIHSFVMVWDSNVFECCRKW